MVKKNDQLYANSDQDFEWFLKFLKDHEMNNYASFLSSYDKDKSQILEYEKESLESYHKYFTPDNNNDFYLHLNDGQKDDEGGTRSFGLIIHRIFQ